MEWMWGDEASRPAGLAAFADAEMPPPPQGLAALAGQWDGLMQSIFGDTIVERQRQAIAAMKRGDRETADRLTTGLATDFGGFLSSIKPIRAFHASPNDFDTFDPSRSFRRASFFAETPEAARKGASAGSGDYYGTRGPLAKTYEVEIRPGSIEGLDLKPRERKWFESLPAEVSEEGIPAVQRGMPKSFDYWWRVYDEVSLPDGTYKYVKKKLPSMEYGDAIKTGRDVYGQQIAHYGGSESKIAEGVRSDGMGGYLIQDEAGLSIAVTDPSLIKILRKYGLAGLTAGGGAAGLGAFAYPEDEGL